MWWISVEDLFTVRTNNQERRDPKVLVMDAMMTHLDSLGEKKRILLGAIKKSL